RSSGRPEILQQLLDFADQSVCERKKLLAKLCSQLVCTLERSGHPDEVRGVPLRVRGEQGELFEVMREQHLELDIAEERRDVGLSCIPCRYVQREASDKAAPGERVPGTLEHPQIGLHRRGENVDSVREALVLRGALSAGGMFER